jgi:hypothetical protein
LDFGNIASTHFTRPDSLMLMLPIFAILQQPSRA